MELLEEMEYIGDVPKGWKWVKLGDAPLNIIDGDRGKNYPSNNELKNNGYCLFLSTKNVKSDGFCFDECQFITKEKDEALKKGKLKRFDLVFTTRGTIGNVGYFNSKVKYENIRINSGMVIIRPDTRSLNPEFNYYIFKFIGKYINSFVSGSAQPQLPIRDLKEVKIPLPPLPEQKAIAGVLSSLDDKIELLHRQNKTLEEMAMTLFRQWFIEPTKDGLPEGWGEVKIGDMLEVVLGGTPSTRIAEYWNGDIPWINSGEINNFRITKATKYITASGLRNSNTKLMPKGTTVLAITGATLGKVSLLEIDTCANQSVVGIVPNDIFPKEYIYLWIKYKIDEIILNETGGAQPHINQNDVRNTEIIKPIKEYLNERNKILKNIFSKITNNVFQIQTLEKLRDTLLPKLMSGEIRVKI